MIWVAFFFAGMLMASWNSKALAAAVLYGLGLVVVYPDEALGAALFGCLFISGFIAQLRP